MCAICGCSDSTETVITNLQTGRHVHLHDGHEHEHQRDHHHDHDDSHAHTHAHPHAYDPALAHSDPHSRTITVEQELLARNSQRAERNRGWFSGRNILALNLMSSPGAGKTTLLERTIRDLRSEMSFHVIEGDQATLKDAERIRATGSSVVQINTGAACHLDAEMVGAALRQLNPPMNSTLFIENVGNLVCPALFDLGEQGRVVVASVTEGDDKPLKYPHMFRSTDLILLNKVDLLPYVDFRMDQFLKAARQLNPKIQVLPISAISGEGLREWYVWMQSLLKCATER